jgi:ribosomal protein L40E
MRIKVYYYNCTCGNQQRIVNQLSLPQRCPVCLKLICNKCGPVGYCKNCEIFLKEEELRNLKELFKLASKSMPPWAILVVPFCLWPFLLLMGGFGLQEESPIYWIIGFGGIVTSIYMIIKHRRQSKGYLKKYVQYSGEVHEKVKNRVNDPEKYFKEEKIVSGRRNRPENTKICQECKKTNPKETEFCFRCGNKFEY